MQHTKDSIAALLADNDLAVVRGIEALYARQTADERAAESTSHSNGMGFNGTDAGILSSFAKQILAWRAADPRNRYRFPLSPKQLGLARKKLFKYAGQLASVANAKAEVAAAAVELEAAAEAVAERAAIQEVEQEAPRVDGAALRAKIAAADEAALRAQHAAEDAADAAVELAAERAALQASEDEDEVVGEFNEFDEFVPAEYIPAEYDAWGEAPVAGAAVAAFVADEDEFLDL